jgi:PAS domain S-box-containing protein
MESVAMLAPDGVMVTKVDLHEGANSRILFVNDALLAQTGYTREELVGQSVGFLYGPLTDSACAKQIHTAILSRQTARAELLTRRKDGSYYWTEILVVPIQDELGEFTNAIAIRRDISERKLADERLHKSQSQLAHAQRIACLGSWEQDLVGNHLEWSEEVYRILGVSPDTFQPGIESFYSLVHPDDREATQQAFIRAVARAKAYACEHRVLRPDGVQRIVREQAEPITDEAGVVRRMVGTIQDITEFKHLEDQLRQSQKMEAIGELAGGVAHDFNNLLTVISGYSDLLRKYLGPEHPLRDYAQEIVDAGERAAALTSQLLAFSRRQMFQPRVLDLNGIVQGMERMLRRVIGEDIVFETSLAADLGRVKADRVQIEQVLLNLALNARDAMPWGGHLRIETKNVHPDDAAALGREDRPHVSITVTDTGVGIEPAIQGRIFEPFFTTKDRKGTGLGLSTVYGIVKQSAGEITVRSSPGHGASFTVFLPRTSECEEVAPDVVAPAATAERHETILLVEDESAVRSFIAEVLRHEGYRVIEAGSGREALATSDAFPGEIHLLMTDVIMPRMSGPELSERLRTRRSNLSVLFMSGYTDNQLDRHGIAQLDTAFIQKPFDADTLAVRVSEVLAPKRGVISVLLADDDLNVRRALSRMLSGAGCQVRDVSSSKQALDLLRTGSFEVFITDLVMSDQEALETIREARDLRPQLKVIVMSGALGGAYFDFASLVGAHAVLQKPVPMERLLNVVREATGPPAPRS